MPTQINGDTYHNISSKKDRKRMSNRKLNHKTNRKLVTCYICNSKAKGKFSTHGCVTHWIARPTYLCELCFESLKESIPIERFNQPFRIDRLYDKHNKTFVLIQEGPDEWLKYMEEIKIAYESIQ